MPTDLERLCTALASWLLRTWSDGTGDWPQVAATLGHGYASTPPDWARQLERFISSELAFTLHPVDLTTGTDDSHWALFPMLDALQMRWTGHDTPLTFARHARTHLDYPQVVDEYFAALSSDKATGDTDASERGHLDTAAGTPQGPSLTALLFADYFLMISRQLARSLAGTPAGTLPTRALATLLGGIGSYHLMNGRRLPDPATTPATLADIRLDQLDMAAAYALNGQQFTLAQVDGKALETITATLSPAAATQQGKENIFFAGGADSVTSFMPAAAVPPAPQPVWSGSTPASADATISVRQLPAMRAEPVCHTLRDHHVWTSPDAPAQCIVPLLNAVLDELSRQPLTLTLHTAVSDGSNDHSPLSVSPALLIQVPIKLVDRPATIDVITDDVPVTPHLPDIFALQGLDDQTRARIRAALAGADLAGASASILYDAPGAGYQSDKLDPAAQPVVLSKTRLSNGAAPGTTTTLFPSGPDAPLTPARLKALLQLLGEAGAEHADACYLRYADADGYSLPPRLFAPHGPAASAEGDTALLTLLVSFPPSTGFAFWHNAFTFSQSGSSDGALLLGVADAGNQPLLQYQPAYPPGCIGFEANRLQDHAALSEPGAPLDSDRVDALYSLMQFRIQGKAADSAPPFVESPWSAALGPMDKSTEQYRQIVPVHRFLAKSDADAPPNSYAAIGGRPSLEFRLNDVFGNALEDATFALDFPVLYNDPLLAPAAWPGVRVSYRFARAAFYLTMHFDQSQVLPADQSAAHIEQAREAALASYARITAQLADPNVRLILTQSVLPSNHGVLGDSETIKAAFAEFAGKAIEWIVDVAAAPSLTQELSIAIDPTDLAKGCDDIFAVTATLTMTRPAALADPLAAAFAPQTVSVSMNLAANLDPAGAGSPQDAGLSLFAEAFEATFQGFDGAKGMARLALGTGEPDVAAPGGLWGVRLSKTAGIHVALPEAQAVCFTLMPLSTTLVDGTAEVPIYDAGTLVPSLTPLRFSGIDLDAWAQIYLAALDQILAPATALAIAAVDGNAYDALVKAKAVLAQALARGLAQVSPSQAGGDLALAQEHFEQSLGTSLAKAYAIDAVVQAPVDVIVKGAAVVGRTAPRFVGKVGATMTRPDPVSGYTIGDAGLPIVDKAVQPGVLNFLVTTPQQGAALQLDLAYQPDVVERMRDDDAMVPERLRFLSRPQNDPLNLALGKVNVPMPMRVAPRAPVLREQDAQQSLAPDASTDSALRWDYTSMVLLDQQDAQDQLWVDVSYNQPLSNNSLQSRLALATLSQVFETLAAFTTAWQVLQGHVLALPDQVFRQASNGPAPAEVIAALMAQVKPVAEALALLRGVAAPEHQPPLAALLAPPQQHTLTDRYVLDFARAFEHDHPVLQVHARARPTGDGCDQASIVWPLINGVAPGAVSPSGVAAPDGDGCWYRSDYPVVRPPESGSLTLMWPRLDVAVRQTATSSYWTVRNANLGGDATIDTNAALVYRTAISAYPAPVIPLINVPATIYTGTSPAQAIGNALRCLPVATGAAGLRRLLKVTLRYRYLAVSSDSDAALPLEMPVLAANDIVLAQDGNAEGALETVQALARQLGDAVQGWYQQQQPSTDHAALLLDVLVTTDIDGARVPIVLAPSIEISVPAGWWQA